MSSIKAFGGFAGPMSELREYVKDMDQAAPLTLDGQSLTKIRIHPHVLQSTYTKTIRRSQMAPSPI